MPSINPRESFDRYQKGLLDEVVILASMVEQAIQQALEALKNRDIEASRQIYQNDELINQKRYQIESETLTLIATQQPMARDLRFLAAILEVITELERIGDYAKGISRINILIGREPIEAPFRDLDLMAERGISMLQRALYAFVNKDTAAARLIPPEDNEIDALYNQIYHDLIKRMIQDPTFIDRANHLIWAAHNLERMADRVTNICERIIFIATGEIRELDHSDDEFMEISNGGM
jgi:phosphate transport system protein